MDHECQCACDTDDETGFDWFGALLHVIDGAIGGAAVLVMLRVMHLL